MKRYVEWRADKLESGLTDERRDRQTFDSIHLIHHLPLEMDWNLKLNSALLRLYVRSPINPPPWISPHVSIQRLFCVDPPRQLSQRVKKDETAAYIFLTLWIVESPDPRIVASRAPVEGVDLGGPNH